MTPSSDSASATCSQPRSQPSPRSVLPRASISPRRASAARRASAVARVDDVDHLVVDDDREPVVVAEAGERLLDRQLGQADLVAAHRAGAVDDEREMDWRPGALVAGARGINLGEHEAVAPVGRADEVAI